MALIPPASWFDEKEHRRKLGTSLQGVLDGHTNNAGTFTIADSTTSTVVSDVRAGIDSVVLWMPLNEAAAGVTGLYMSSRGDGTFTLAHDSGSFEEDAEFEYVLCATGRTP